MLVLNVDLVKVRGAGSHYFTVEPHLVPVSGVVTIFYIKHLFIYLVTYLLTYLFPQISKTVLSGGPVSYTAVHVS